MRNLLSFHLTFLLRLPASLFLKRLIRPIVWELKRLQPSLFFILFQRTSKLSETSIPCNYFLFEMKRSAELFSSISGEPWQLPALGTSLPLWLAFWSASALISGNKAKWHRGTTLKKGHYLIFKCCYSSSARQGSCLSRGRNDAELNDPTLPAGERVPSLYFFSPNWQLEPYNYTFDGSTKQEYLSVIRLIVGWWMTTWLLRHWLGLI